VRIIIILFSFQFLALSISGQVGQSAQESFFPVKIKQLWGMMNAKGKVVIEPKYDAIGEFKEYGYAVMQREGRVGLLNKFGREIIPAEYDDIKILDSLIFAVLDASDWAVVNIQGKIILKNGYEQVHIWKGEFIGFRKNRKWGLADTNGKVLSTAKYDEIDLFEDNFFLTKIGEKKGLLSVDGKEILGNDSDEIELYNSNLFFFYKNKKWGAVNQNGELLIRPSFQSFFTLSENFIKLVSNSRVYLYSVSNQQMITKGEYETYYPFSKKYVLAKNNRKIGLLNTLGNEILKVKYDEIQSFAKDQFRVNFQGQWGVVTIGDHIIVPFEYEYVTPLKSNICVVKKNKKLGIVNFKGQEQVLPKYDKITIENNKAKAYQKEVLTVLNFDKEGNLQGEDQFENHLTLKIGAKKNQVVNRNADDSDYQLDQFEWYYDAKQDQWGLRRLEDGSIHIEPVFDYIQMERDINFTLVGIEKSNKYSFNKTEYRFEMIFGLVDNRNGLLITPVELLDVRFSDFKNGYPSARVVFENGTHGLIARNGTFLVKDYAYIDDFQEGIARMSMQGKLSGEMNSKNKNLGTVKKYLHHLLAPSGMIDYTLHDQDFKDQAEMICKNCNWGYIDTSGKVVVNPQFSNAEKIVNQIGIVEKGDKMGAIKTDGSTLLQCEYDAVDFLENTDYQILKVYKSASKVGLIDTLSEVAVDLKYDEIGDMSEGRLAVAKNGLWGFADLNGKEIVRCRYRKAGKFQEGYAAVQLGNKWGFIDQEGKIVIEFKYRRVGNFKDGLAWVSTASGVGYINNEDEKVIRTKFEKAFDFEDNVARVVVDGKFGLINKQGDYFLRPKYNHIYPFNEHGIAIVQLGKEKIRYGLLNRTGDLETKKSFQRIESFSEGLAKVELKNKFGFINPQGKIIIECKYSKVSPFKEGLAAVSKNGACGYINQEGKEVIALKYSKCLNFEDAKAIVYQGMRKAGIIDKAGKEEISPSIKGLVGFSDRRGLIKGTDGNFYFITEDGRFYDGYYDYAESFQYGVAIVQKNGKWGIINQNGIPVISTKYDKIEPFNNGFAKVRINGFSGLTNLAGELIVDPDFEFISYAGDGLFRVEQGDKVGYFDSEGEWIWELQN